MQLCSRHEILCQNLCQQKMREAGTMTSSDTPCLKNYRYFALYTQQGLTGSQEVGSIVWRHLQQIFLQTVL